MDEWDQVARDEWEDEGVAHFEPHKWGHGFIQFRQMEFGIMGEISAHRQAKDRIGSEGNPRTGMENNP